MWEGRRGDVRESGGEGEWGGEGKDEGHERRVGTVCTQVQSIRAFLSPADYYYYCLLLPYSSPHH